MCASLQSFCSTVDCDILKVRKGSAYNAISWTGQAANRPVFDCDMGNSIDAALAMALLYGFDGKSEVRVVAVSISRNNLHSRHWPKRSADSTPERSAARSARRGAICRSG